VTNPVSTEQVERPEPGSSLEAWQVYAGRLEAQLARCREAATNASAVFIEFVEAEENVPTYEDVQLAALDLRAALAESDIRGEENG
jgi:hypothetical protein